MKRSKVVGILNAGVSKFKGLSKKRRKAVTVIGGLVVLGLVLGATTTEVAELPNTSYTESSDKVERDRLEIERLEKERKEKEALQKFANDTVRDNIYKAVKGGFMEDKVEVVTEEGVNIIKITREGMAGEYLLYKDTEVYYG